MEEIPKDRENATTIGRTKARRPRRLPARSPDSTDVKKIDDHAIVGQFDTSTTTESPTASTTRENDATTDESPLLRSVNDDASSVPNDDASSVPNDDQPDPNLSTTDNRHEDISSENATSTTTETPTGLKSTSEIAELLSKCRDLEISKSNEDAKKISDSKKCEKTDEDYFDAEIEKVEDANVEPSTSKTTIDDEKTENERDPVSDLKTDDDDAKDVEHETDDNNDESESRFLLQIELRNSLDTGNTNPDIADRVDVYYRGDRTSIALERAKEIYGSTSMMRTGNSLWRNVFRRFCRGFRICNWFPNMCLCRENGSSISGSWSSGRPGSYERLRSGTSLIDFGGAVPRTRRRTSNANEDAVDNERQAELVFYNDNMTWTEVCVEKDLRIMDLCELLKVKRNVPGTSWSIVESWPELGIERTLEDHEDILVTHREMELFAPEVERKFYFRQDFLKYELFVCPRQFFPSDMVTFPKDVERQTGGDFEEPIRNYLNRQDAECPKVSSLVWLREDSSDTWRKTRMMLCGRKLYIAKKSHGAVLKRNSDQELTCPLVHLADYHIYRIPNAGKSFNAPFDYGICLRPSSNAEAEDVQPGIPGIKVIAFTSESSRTCWLTAMRLAKYGKQLRENYRAFRNKQCEQNGAGSPKEQYSSYNVPNESLRSRVAMDFTGSVGRIVEDPKEAKDIAESEGVVWRRRWRPFSRPPPACGMLKFNGLEGGIHALQPWFHSGLNRDYAASIIKEQGSVDGVFLVRESKSNPGAYVLTYKYSDKVFHTQIQPVFDERHNSWLYTLDKGATKFYDLLQLIEFYQLNTGSLPTRLTHYVQHGMTAGSQRQEDGGTSPLRPIVGNRIASPKTEGPRTTSGI